MNLSFSGLTVGVVGKILLAAGVIIAHTELAHERKIDDEVLNSFKLELVLTIIGIILIVLGYLIEIYFYGLTPLLTCDALECGAAVGELINAR